MVFQLLFSRPCKIEVLIDAKKDYQSISSAILLHKQIPKVIPNIQLITGATYIIESLFRKQAMVSKNYQMQLGELGSAQITPRILFGSFVTAH